MNKQNFNVWASELSTPPSSLSIYYKQNKIICYLLVQYFLFLLTNKIQIFRVAIIFLNIFTTISTGFITDNKNSVIEIRIKKYVN